MTDERLAQARAEAERQWPGMWLGDSKFLSQHRAFEKGVEWADANPQPRTITREAAREAWLSGEDFGDFADALRAAGIEVTDDE